MSADEAEADTEIAGAWEREEDTRVQEILDGRVQLLTQDDLNRRLDAIRAKHSA